MKNELLTVPFEPPSAAAAFYPACKTTLRAQKETSHLKRGHVIRLERKQQFKKIAVRSGLLWLTGTPAEGDLILGPGEAFEFQNRWPYVIEAIEATEISLT